VGIHYGLGQARKHPSLDTLLHSELNLSQEQNRRIEALEAEFAARKTMLESEMRAANRDLAAAMTSEHAYGQGAQAAIERFHIAESALQIETVKHVLAMRTVLTPQQTKRFDDAVSAALTSD
jgi:Spy/CpxP family protein refolding chaperone